MDYILKIFKSKVGISLFLSWVLLILITVSIGTTVYLWAKTFSQNQTSVLTQNSEQASCSSVGVGVVSACQTSNTLLLDLKNQKDLKIKGFLISLVYLYNDVDTIELNKTLDVYKTIRITVPKSGVVSKVIITPKISVNGEIVVCSQNPTSKEDIDYC